MQDIPKILIRLAKKIISFFLIKDNDCVFRLVAIEMHPQKRNASLTFQVIGVNKVITKNLSQVYNDDIEGFSKYDARYIGFLYGNLNSPTDEFLRLIPSNSNSAPKILTAKVFFLALLSTSFLILSNLVGPKITTVFEYEFNAGLLFFPIILIISDITTEVYGYKVNRMLIWLAFMGNAIIALGVYLVVMLPSAKVWGNQEAYKIVFNFSLRTLTASAFAF